MARNGVCSARLRMRETSVIDRRAAIEAFTVAAIVTGLVTLASRFASNHVATGVGLTFLGATWAMVWRRDDDTVEKYGLAFGGLVLPGSIDRARVFRSVGQA